MYKVHLIIKYLLKRRIAWIALAAVSLCTAMVLVVISVMGGWVNMFRESQHGLTGDVVIYRQSLTGFPHYQEMIDEVRKLPEVKAVVPVIKTFGLINIDDQIRSGVQVWAYGDLKEAGKVNGFVNSLYMKPDVLRQRMAGVADPSEIQALEKKAANFPSFDPPLPPSMLADRYASLFPKSKVNAGQWPGMIVGTGVIGVNKDEDGKVHRSEEEFQAWARLTVLGMNDSSSVDFTNKSERNYWLADDSHTGVYIIDAGTVYVPFDLLQKDLGMDEQQVQDPMGNPVTIPARANEIQISLKPGVDLNAAAIKIDQQISPILARYNLNANNPLDLIRTETWEKKQAEFIAAIEHEKSLLTILFAIISIVAIFQIFCIFFMIVMEKTRDIGILKSVGATNEGVQVIFLGYGLVIGVLGGGIGLLLGYLVVHNINYLHEKMSQLLGVKIWDPKTYLFDTIPNKLNTMETTIIVAVAVLSALIGAAWPAYRAGRMNPVEALRWE